MRVEDIKEGQSFEFKVRRTKFSLVYEDENEWYRFETATSKENTVSYIMYKDLPTLYSIMTKGLVNKPEIILISDSDAIERTKLFNRGQKLSNK